MSRDEVWVHFAAAAVTGILAHQEDADNNLAVDDAAEVADALMVERDKRLREAKAS